jgi:hypothetical protein
MLADVSLWTSSWIRHEIYGPLISRNVHHALHLSTDLIPLPLREALMSIKRKQLSRCTPQSGQEPTTRYQINTKQPDSYSSLATNLCKLFHKSFLIRKISRIQYETTTLSCQGHSLSLPNPVQTTSSQPEQHPELKKFNRSYGLFLPYKFIRFE